MGFSLNKNIQLLNAEQYISDLTWHVQRAQTRITIMSLIIVDDSSTHKLMNALIDAAKRGVIVTIAADNYTYTELGGAFSPFKRLTKASRTASETARRFIKAGASFTWLGDTFKLNPFSGSTHSKWSIVDDICYLFGGVNLCEFNIKSTDYMLKIPNAQLARNIRKQHHAIIQSESHSSRYPGYLAQNASLSGTIFIDNGEPNNSPIYNRACELAKKAAHVLFVSQYCPSGPLATHIKGTQHHLYFNQPHNTPFPANVHIWWDQTWTHTLSLYTHKEYIHAKFIVFTLVDGKKIALTGSHNFNYTGVLFGTKEVALETTDTSVIEQLEQFCAETITR